MSDQKIIELFNIEEFNKSLHETDEKPLLNICYGEMIEDMDLVILFLLPVEAVKTEFEFCLMLSKYLEKLSDNNIQKIYVKNEAIGNRFRTFEINDLLTAVMIMIELINEAMNAVADNDMDLFPFDLDHIKTLLNMYTKSDKNKRSLKEFITFRSLLLKDKNTEIYAE